MALAMAMAAMAMAHVLNKKNFFIAVAGQNRRGYHVDVRGPYKYRHVKNMFKAGIINGGTRIMVTDRSGPFAWTPRTYGLAFWVAAANVVLLHHLIPHLCGDCTADPQLPDILTVEPGALVEGVGAGVANLSSPDHPPTPVYIPPPAVIAAMQTAGPGDEELGHDAGYDYDIDGTDHDY